MQTILVACNVLLGASLSTFEIFNRLTKKLRGWRKYHYSIVCVFTGLIRLHGDDSLTGTIHIESKYFLLIIFLAKKKIWLTNAST